MANKLNIYSKLFKRKNGLKIFSRHFSFRNANSLNVSRHLLFFCFLVIYFIVVGVGCKKMIVVPPQPTSINNANVFSNDLTATGAINALYINSNIENLFQKAGLLADELELYDLTVTDFLPYYRNALRDDAGNTWGTWSGTYRKIYIANAAIEQLEVSKTLTPAVKQQLLGEAKFMRAFYYFYLVNLYGDIPMSLTTDPEVNRLLARTPVPDVYMQLAKDLTDAKDLLSKNFLAGDVQSISDERVRPTYWAATALLARIYLYQGNYNNAIIQSSELIDKSGGRFSLESIDAAFLKNTKETIWALQSPPSGPPYNTREGEYLILPSGPRGPSNGWNNLYKTTYLSDFIANAFEAGDKRKTNWVKNVTVGTISFPYSYKYKADRTEIAVTEYTIVLRIAEQYLIRAEAYAMLGSKNSALADLNTIRDRARAESTVNVPDPLPPLTADLTNTQVYAAIEQERKVELFTEWGHRWFDLKRMAGLKNPSEKRADEVMPDVCAHKGGQWSPNWKLLPIPREQLTWNPNMAKSQNPGY